MLSASNASRAIYKERLDASLTVAKALLEAKTQQGRDSLQKTLSGNLFLIGNSLLDFVLDSIEKPALLANKTPDFVGKLVNAIRRDFGLRPIHNQQIYRALKVGQGH